MTITELNDDHRRKKTKQLLNEQLETEQKALSLRRVGKM